MLFLVPILRKDEVAAYDYRMELPIQWVTGQGARWEEQNASRLEEIGEKGGVIMNPSFSGGKIVTNNDRGGPEMLLVRYPVQRR